MDLFDLVAKITLDSSEYEKSIDSAESKGSAFGEKLKGALANGAKVTAAAVATLGTSTIALGKAFVSATGDVADYGDEIDKASQKIGFSAEAYQEWDAVLEHSGSSMSAVQTSLRTLTKAAEDNNEEFEKLGITQEQLATMSNEELFNATITGLQNMTDETERSRTAQTLLGRGSMELGALLNTSAKDTKAMKDRVHELGGVMSNEAVKAAANYKDKLQDMKTAIGGLKNSVMADFLPGVSQVMDGLTEIFSGDSDKGIGMISEGIDSIIDKLSDKAPEFMEAGGKIVLSIGQAIIDNLPKLTQSGAKIILELVQQIIAELPQIGATATEIITTLVKSLAEAAPDLIPAAADAVIALAEGLVDNADEMLDAGLELILGLAEGLADAAPKLVEKVPILIGKLVSGLFDPENWKKLVDAGGKIIGALLEGAVNSVGALISGIVSAITGEDLPGKLKEVTSAVTPFTQALQECNPEISDYNELLSSAGNSLGELDRAIEESEKAITEILKGAAAENRGLREEEIIELQAYNEELRRLWEEKLSIYRDNQISEMLKAQLDDLITQEEAAQYIKNAQAAYEQANKLVEQMYSAELSQIQNLHNTSQLTDQEYASRLESAKEHYAQSLSENQNYYNDALTVIAKGGQEWVTQSGKTGADLYESIKSGGENANLATMKAFLELLATVKAEGGAIDEESQALVYQFIQNISGALEEEGVFSHPVTEALQGMVSGMEEMVPDLEGAGDKSGKAILMSLMAAFAPNGGGAASGDLANWNNYITNSIGKGLGEGLASGMGESERDVKDASADLGAAATSGLSSAKKDGKSAGENYGDGLASGMDGKYDKVYAAAAKVARAAKQAVERTLQIASPSKVALALGKFFGEGMVLGVEAEIPDVEKASEDMAKALTDPIGAPELSYNTQINTEGGSNNGVLSELLAALADLKDNIQITVMLDDGTLLTRIDTGLGTIAQRKARGN